VRVSARHEHGTGTMTKHGEGSQNTLAALERRTRLQLAACYRIFACRDMDDLIFTHLSARLPGRDNRFLFIRFGMLFDEVTASNLLEVDIDGTPSLNGVEVNPAGWIVHRVVYDAAPEAQCVMHLHTVSGTAVSAQKQGLLPLNQFGITSTARSPTTNTTAQDSVSRSKENSLSISETNE
jgi:ribulose-5-phosphate 4-epimerase/fuculose-1-phosphate aldolase